MSRFRPTSLPSRILRRGGKILGASLLAFVVLSTALVLILRWAPIPVATVQVQRELEARFDGRDHRAAPAQWISLEAMGPHLPRAVVAAEDQRFFEHRGFDFVQLEKAIAEHQNGGRLRGASTISQQTAKNLFLWHGRSYLRKALEAWFTVLLEFLWSKERILEVYLNIVEFGPEIYGVDAASRIYFQRNPAQLRRDQAALLAAVLPNPHRLHADRPSDYVRERQAWILQYMPDG